MRICQSMFAAPESDECNTLKALIILLFLFGSEEQNDDNNNLHGHLPIFATREHNRRFMDIFKLTRNSEGRKDVYDVVVGTFCLALLADVCMVISRSDSNK